MGKGGEGVEKGWKRGGSGDGEQMNNEIKHY